MTYLLANYANKEALITAAKQLPQAKVYTSFEIKELSDISQREPIDFAPIGLMGAVVGGSLGYFMEYYLSVRDLPLNLGGRPIHTAIAFIPVTFECAVFAAAISIVMAFFISLKLPEYYHPLFNSHRFLLSRENPFFIVVDENQEQELRATQPLSVERIAT